MGLQGVYLLKLRIPVLVILLCLGLFFFITAKNPCFLLAMSQKLRNFAAQKGKTRLTQPIKKQNNEKDFRICSCCSRNESDRLQRQHR